MGEVSNGGIAELTRFDYWFIWGICGAIDVALLIFVAWVIWL